MYRFCFETENSGSFVANQIFFFLLFLNLIEHNLTEICFGANLLPLTTSKPSPTKKHQNTPISAPVQQKFCRIQGVSVTALAWGVRVVAAGNDQVVRFYTNEGREHQSIDYTNRGKWRFLVQVRSRSRAPLSSLPKMKKRGTPGPGSNLNHIFGW